MNKGGKGDGCNSLHPHYSRQLQTRKLAIARVHKRERDGDKLKIVNLFSFHGCLREGTMYKGSRFGHL